MKTIRGIIVHQTGSPTAAGTLSSYQNANANGAHFLIDKDGSIYQVASLFKKTWHVGKLRAKCLEAHTCSAAVLKANAGLRYSEVDRLEMRKSVPDRFPSNDDSIGIELVGLCVLDRKYVRAGMSKEQTDQLTAKFGVFEAVTPAQNQALKRLILKIQGERAVPENEVYPHSEVSRKNMTEASTARWK
ncbi:MAG: N-acetylmuramoyl-L-alanine amidase [Burkholderiales bacterium]|nr:peptidoglycan recognition protein family protein [Burkholderiales bacterium]MDE1925650.1 N-acetylmuramoyl-L-alanine amidase [Burkholderiales bacterium]MDE2503419.1 N-acetylmuramoyl-L-alanine amidase [Burkholderiales bacterium]